MPRYNNLIFPHHPGATPSYTPSTRGHEGAQTIIRGSQEGRTIGDPRPSHSIPMDKFHYGGDEDFDEWIQSFEDACIVANHPDSADAKNR
jgi:hypothetical protein